MTKVSSRLLALLMAATLGLMGVMAESAFAGPRLYRSPVDPYYSRSDIYREKLKRAEDEGRLDETPYPIREKEVRDDWAARRSNSWASPRVSAASKAAGSLAKGLRRSRETGLSDWAPRPYVSPFNTCGSACKIRMSRGQ
jgi:hypothetical protein